MKRFLHQTALLLTTILLVGAFVVYQGFIRFNYPSHERFPVRGIDVSHHQGPIDWGAVRAQGVRFAFIKATEGTNFVDPRFAENWDRCRDAGLLCGAYHFFNLSKPALDQAQHFLNVADPAGVQLPPVVDVEYYRRLGTSRSGAVAVTLRRCLEEVERRGGRRPILYVAGDAYDEVVSLSFGDFPIWRRDIFFEPPGAGQEWIFWQFANRGRLRGIDAFVDLNVFYSTSLGDLHSWIK